jgi:hypothetical protein
MKRIVASALLAILATGLTAAGAWLMYRVGWTESGNWITVVSGTTPNWTVGGYSIDPNVPWYDPLASTRRMGQLFSIDPEFRSVTLAVVGLFVFVGLERLVFGRTYECRCVGGGRRLRRLSAPACPHCSTPI